MWYSRSSPGLDWRPKNLRNFLRDFHFSFMSYCWRSWAPSSVCPCVWHHPQRGACSGDFWTHKSSVRKVKTVFIVPVSQSLLLFIFLFWRSNFKWPLCLFIIVLALGSVAFIAVAAAATAAVGITKSLNQLLTTGRVSQPKQQQQQKVSQVADWARNEVICRQLRQTAACVIPPSNPA